jgi:hypothetical protein
MGVYAPVIDAVARRCIEGLVERRLHWVGRLRTMKFLSVLWMTASTRPTRNALVTILVMARACTPYALFTRCPTPVALHSFACHPRVELGYARASESRNQSQGVRKIGSSSRLLGGGAHPLAACGVATLCCSPPVRRVARHTTHQLDHVVRRARREAAGGG